MKLEVGMYVRDIKGRIDKIIGFKGALIEFEKDLMGGYIDCNDFIKASFNIIDLIEKGDYINGEKIDYISISKDGEKRPLIKDNIYFFEKYISIKSIITKEQFEEMSYKVGE